VQTQQGHGIRIRRKGRSHRPRSCREHRTNHPRCDDRGWETIKGALTPILSTARKNWESFSGDPFLEWSSLESKPVPNTGLTFNNREGHVWTKSTSHVTWDDVLAHPFLRVAIRSGRSAIIMRSYSDWFVLTFLQI
jgi:hypothetical protein